MFQRKIIILPKNKFCTKQEVNSIKPFDCIPGPKSYPLIGTLYKYLPLIGEYKFDRLHYNGARKFRKYGFVVREDIIPSVTIMWLFNPEDFEILFRCEGRYPERRSHLALQKYRLDRPEIYSSGGLLPTNGPEWWRLRKEFQKELSKIQNVRLYLSKSDKIIKKFLLQKASKKHDDFLPELARLFLELTGLVVFDEEFGSFTDQQYHPYSQSSKLITSAATINSCILKTDNGPHIWKKFNTPIYSKLMKAHQFIEKVAINYVEKKKQNLTEKAEIGNSLLERYLANKNLDTKDIIGITTDMLLAGIDTMSYTCSFALYHLSTNIDKQNIMRKELYEIIPSVDDAIDGEHINKCIYTKAVIKEVFRLNPISVGVGRNLQTDAVFSNYFVPSGTVMVTQNQVVCRLPEYFPNPDRFIPERWIKENENFHTVHPYLCLPFGHGPRTCIARRLAEQNIQLFLMNVIRKYEIRWFGEELGSRSLLINKPDKPVKVHFSRI